MRRFLTMTALLAFAALAAAACSTGYGYGPAGDGYGSSVPPWGNTGGADPAGIYHPGMGGANG
jgi:hypothetical protein